MEIGLTSIKNETWKIWFSLLAGHLFCHPGARSAQAPLPSRGNELSGSPSHESYGVTAAVWRCGGVTAATVGRRWWWSVG